MGFILEEYAMQSCDTIAFEATIEENMYSYRLVFTYPAQPARIALANVGYAPNKTIFYFKGVLDSSQKQAIVKIAKTLSPIPLTTISFEEEYKSQDKWIKYEVEKQK